MMDRQTAEALEGSIEKWRKIAVREARDSGKFNCPLCSIFLSASDQRLCYGCPVHEFTGEGACRGTPYRNYDKHQANKHCGSGENLCGTCTRLAKAEVNFLESLREEKK